MLGPESENSIKNCEDSPPQGLSEARRAGEVFPYCFWSLIRRGGAPPGAAAFIVPEYS